MPDETKEPGTRIELPCGLFRDGKAQREAEIVPMTGRVRKNIARPDVRKNGAKIIDAVLLACVREIGGRRVDRQVLDELLIGDRDFLTLKIREVSLGEVVSAEMHCGGCKEKIDFQVNLADIKAFPLAEGDCEVAEDGTTRVFHVDSDKHALHAVFRFPSGKDQHAIVPLASQNPVEANYRMYGLCLESWNGQKKPFPPTFIENLPLSTLDFVDAAFASRMPGPELDHEVVCDVCGTANPMSLEVSNFLCPTPQEARKRRQRA